MKGKSQLVISVCIALGGAYAFADALNFVPGPLTVAPLQGEPIAYPSVVPATPATVPTVSSGAETEKGTTPAASASSSAGSASPSSTGASDRRVSAAAVANAVKELESDPRRSGELSLEVRDAATGTVLAEKAPEKGRTPASSMKLVTAAAALTQFGADRQFSTTAAREGSTVYLIGGGDTMLAAGAGNPAVAEGHAGLGDLAKATAAKLKAAGVTTVSLRVDTSLFGGDAYHPRVEGADRSFIMAMSPVAVNESRDATGAFTADPGLGAGNVFAQRLKENGIAVTNVSGGKAGAGATKLASVQSATLRRIVDQMLTESDNTLAETLGHLVAVDRGLSADFPGGAKAVTQVLKELDYPLEGVRISDNSGLSTDNRVTTGLELAILDDVLAGKYPAIAAGVPVSGYSGTLANRMGGDMGGHVRAKTGTLVRSISLCGLLRTDNGQLLEFALFADELDEGTALQARESLDTFLTNLAGA